MEKNKCNGVGARHAHDGQGRITQGPTEKVMFDQSSEGGEAGSLTHIWSVPDRSHHKYNNPEVRRPTRRPCALWGEKWNISCHIREQRISQSSQLQPSAKGKLVSPERTYLPIHGKVLYSLT